MRIYKTVYSTCLSDICLWLVFSWIVGELWWGLGVKDSLEYLPGVVNYWELERVLVWIRVDVMVLLALSIIFW